VLVGDVDHIVFYFFDGGSLRTRIGSCEMRNVFNFIGDQLRGVGLERKGDKETSHFWNVIKKNNIFFCGEIVFYSASEKFTQYNIESSVSPELDGVSSLVARPERRSALNQEVALSPQSSALESG
jgi:hypothetical protein